MEVKKIAEEQEIWDNNEEIAKSKKETKQLVPERFHKQIHIFGKKTSKRIPTRKLWDHTINMKKGFVPRKEKIYLLSREEREKIHKFISEQLRKGYIRPLKLPQIVPVFFVGKKNGKKHIVQNYRYFNRQTIKNNYPLSLILDIIENIGTKRVFTKMDLRWGYNNIQIKEGNKWKAVFTTLERLFELTMVVFELTNSLVTFQTIINEILQDLINTWKVVSFINNVIVGMETEEGPDEIVEEVVKRLVKKDLYVKSEK